jgi:hypothetical protein
MFEGLPARAIVLDALAPAVDSGVITLIDGDCAGILVVQNGSVSDAVCFVDGSRTRGAEALAQIRSWGSATMSARRWTEAAMSLVDPLLHGDMCYDDLRLEWTSWSQLLGDLRARGRTFVVELTTPTGRGVTIVRGGQQVAAYSESHPSLGDPELLDQLAAGGTGSVRILVASDIEQPRDAFPASLLKDARTSHPEDPSMHVDARDPADDANATLSALFGAHLATAALAPLIVLNGSRASTEVASVRPELKRMVQRRLQRSSRPVEEIVDAAADDHQSVAWLADRVRATRIRGFMASTFEQLADDMLALTPRP